VEGSRDQGFKGLFSKELIISVFPIRKQNHKICKAS
jgi:hypothetical protein